MAKKTHPTKVADIAGYDPLTWRYYDPYTTTTTSDINYTDTFIYTGGTTTVYPTNPPYQTEEEKKRIIKRLEELMNSPSKPMEIKPWDFDTDIISEAKELIEFSDDKDLNINDLLVLKQLIESRLDKLLVERNPEYPSFEELNHIRSLLNRFLAGRAIVSKDEFGEVLYSKAFFDEFTKLLSKAKVTLPEQLKDVYSLLIWIENMERYHYGLLKKKAEEKLEG